MSDFERFERALVVTAHPDDVDFGAAGTVATLVDHGVKVSYCLCTDGDAGGFDPLVPRDQIGGIRRAEQTAAAAEVGVTDLHFLGHPDGRLVPSIELRRDISRVIRQVQPDLVITQSPERQYKRIFASHPDHLAAGEATLSAVYPDARNPYAHLDLAAEGLEAWTVREVWLMAANGADHWVDITDAIDRKVAALRCHESQHTEPEALDERMRGWGVMVAKAGGLTEGRMAEGFLVVPTG